MSDTALQEAKRRLILPALLHQLGLGHLAKKSAKCPFHDDGRNSFSVFRGEGGAWFWKCFAGCGRGDEITFLEKHKGISTREAIRMFREMAGCAPVDRPPVVGRDKPEKANNTGFDWQACVDALTESDLEQLGNERWLSRAFCSWLHNSKLIGKHGWYVAFPNGNGEVKGAHVWRGEKDWYHHPSGVGTHPFVIGDLKRAKQVHLFESQWDMLAFADRCGNYEAQGVAFVATRGASNAALVKDRLPQGASVVAWPQADAAGEKWLSDLSAFVRQLGVARVPASIKKRNEFGDTVEVMLKDMNDWTKAGAGAEDIYAAFFRNELYKPVPVERALIASEPVGIEQSSAVSTVENAKQTAQAVEGDAGCTIRPLRVEPSKVPMNFEQWQAVIMANFPEYARPAEICASVFAQLLLNDVANPFALVLVDVPSSGKTITLNFFDVPELAYATDNFTPASFVSHASNIKREDLAKVDMLPRIRYRVLIIRDLAPIFGEKDDDLVKTLGILTRALDGEGLQIDSGVHGSRGYRGDFLFMMLAASTPISPRIFKAMATLGSRLFFLQLHSQTRSYAQLVSENRGASRQVKERTCREATNSFLRTLWASNPNGVEWDKEGDPEDCLVTIARCAELLAALRGAIQVWTEMALNTTHRLSNSLTG